jgi:hypothetical protein
MSEMETHKGKLVPLVCTGCTLEERAEDVCGLLGFEKSEYHSTWVECLEEEGYKRVLILDDEHIYEIQDCEVDPYGFANATRNNDGTIDYFISWYNGGASMDEVLKEAIEDNEK